MIIENHASQNNYFWYVIRALRSVGVSFVQPVTKRPGDLAYVASGWTRDDRSFVIDLRDTHSLPLEVLEDVEADIVYKSNFSSELWNLGQRESLQRTGIAITESERVWRSKIRPLALGRALDIPQGTNELEFYARQTKPRLDISCVLGGGTTAMHSDARLKLLELITDVSGIDSHAFWFRSDRCDHRKDVPNFAQRTWRFELPESLSGVGANLRAYYDFISEGRWNLDTPGFCLSQPFRLVDGVLAGVPSISTKAWNDAYLDFPCKRLNVCGFTGEGDWELAELELRDIFNMDEGSRLELIEAQRDWYNDHLSAHGMRRQLREILP